MDGQGPVTLSLEECAILKKIFLQLQLGQVDIDSESSLWKNLEVQRLLGRLAITPNDFKMTEIRSQL